MRRIIKNYLKKLLAVVVYFLPVFALAQDSFIDYDVDVSTRYTGRGGGGGGLWDLLYIILDILDIVVVLIVALAVVYFLIGILKYITSGGDEDKRKEAGKMMTFGVIGLFVMISFWGIVNILVNTFDLDDSPPDVPYLYDSVLKGGNASSKGGGIDLE